MGWGAEGSAFAVTGALFLLSGAFASSPMVRAGRTALVVIFAAAAVFIGAGFLTRTHGGWLLSPWTWLLPIFPAFLTAILGARLFAKWAPRHRIATCVVPSRGDRRKSASGGASHADASARLEKAADPAASGAELADLAYSHPELRVTIAANPATSANVLGWLASSGGEGIAAAIAARGSGNTPRRSADGPRNSEKSPSKRAAWPRATHDPDA